MADYSLRPATVKDYTFLRSLHVATMKDYVAQTWGWDEAFQGSITTHLPRRSSRWVRQTH